MGFFDKMFSGLTKTRKNIEELEEVFRNYDIDSEDFYDELEEMLIMADVGGETTAQIMMDYKRILLRRYIIRAKPQRRHLSATCRTCSAIWTQSSSLTPSRRLSSWSV